MDRELYLKIGRPQNVCVKCGAAISHAGKHPSALYDPDLSLAGQEEDDAEPLRQDFCPSCWAAMRSDKEYFSFWLARRDPPKPKKLQNRKERNATLLSYFDYLCAKQDPEYIQHLYFLAHLLMKYSVLKWVRTDPPENEGEPNRIVFRNTVTDDFIAIYEVPLDGERIAAIKKEIDESLQRLERDGAPEPDAPEGGEPAEPSQTD
jgi:hypothetical protein